MTIHKFYEGSGVSLFEGHVIDALRTLPDESVQCCVTSPPYWALRNYGLPPQIWGGDAGCQHEWNDQGYRLQSHGDDGSAGGLDGSTGTQQQTRMGVIASAICLRCGAWLGNLGLEPTPDLFVEHLVLVFREVRRVLRKDGTLWLNMGDSYNGSGGAGGDYGAGGMREGQAKYPGHKAPELKAKDLVGVPWMLAFALRADGWWLRQDIVWAKPNPMPESVRDRCTKAHEYIFLLAKSRHYFYDAAAIAEASITPEGTIATGSLGVFGPGEQWIASRAHRGSSPAVSTGTRNRRSVWTIATQPYTGAHFATFPETIPERAILAGTSDRGCCPWCGAPWQRVIEQTGVLVKRESAHQPGNTATKVDSTGWQPATCATQEWRQACDCTTTDPVGCTVLDPFAGSGTTLAVAQRLGRRGIGIELNPDYCALAVERLSNQPGMLMGV